MADKSIGALPLAATINDDSLFAVAQQGTSMAVTGLLLKGYAKHGVEMEFEEDVQKSNAAADRAEAAAKEIEGMMVSAHASETATVSKGLKDGKVHLSFGLPRGEKGEQGIEGPVGPRGAKGEPGNGLTMLGHYSTEEALRNAVKSPKVGDAYSIGEEIPYDTYVYDGTTLDWLNYGPFTGGGGIIPAEAVTTEGGAEIITDIGIGPHVIEFIDEELPPLTAEDIAYDDGTVADAIESLFTSVADGKEKVASAISDKGVPTDKDATFEQIAENIGKITTGGSTEDATATALDILGGKTAYVATGKVEGQIPSLPTKEYTPSNQAQTINSGLYIAGKQTIKGDTSLVSSNIRKGVSIFGVVGEMTSSFLATVTVAVDAGAVVEATHTDGTKLEKLCETGQLEFELPKEGQWTFTARRGVEQYNADVVNVTSRYNVRLTTLGNVVYVSGTDNLSKARGYLAATHVGDYALFGGGIGGTFTVDAYDTTLERTTAPDFSGARDYPSAAHVGDYALFDGGSASPSAAKQQIDAYSSTLEHTTHFYMSAWRSYVAATNVGNHALFGGGYNFNGGSYYDTVYAYDETLSQKTPSSLSVARANLAATHVGNYALFGGGQSGSIYYDTVDAYSSTLERITPPQQLSVERGYFAATHVGNYALFGGGEYSSNSVAIISAVVDAYSATLERITPAELSTARRFLSATHIGNYAMFGGGRSGSDSSVIDAYSPTLEHSIAPPLSVARQNLAATHVGNYALFGGGNSSSAVDAYKDERG